MTSFEPEATPILIVSGTRVLKRAEIILNPFHLADISDTVKKKKKLNMIRRE